MITKRKANYTAFVIIETILCAAILAAIVAATTGCTTAETKSISRPVLNRDGTVIFDQYGNYPKEIVIEVKAAAGPTSEIEAWMLETDITKSAEDLTFHTGSTGTGMKGGDAQMMLQLLTLVNQLMLKLFTPVP